MVQVRITGWQVGCNKVKVTNALCLHSQLNLSQAKQCTDSVLDGESVIVEIETDDDAHELAKELNTFGAIAYVVRGQSVP